MSTYLATRQAEARQSAFARAWCVQYRRRGAASHEIPSWPLAKTSRALADQTNGSSVRNAAGSASVQKPRGGQRWASISRASTIRPRCWSNARLRARRLGLQPVSSNSRWKACDFHASTARSSSHPSSFQFIPHRAAPPWLWNVSPAPRVRQESWLCRSCCSGSARPTTAGETGGWRVMAEATRSEDGAIVCRWAHSTFDLAKQIVAIKLSRLTQTLEVAMPLSARSRACGARRPDASRTSAKLGHMGESGGIV